MTAANRTCTPKNHKCTMEITVTHNENAEQLNGRLAMLGVIAAIGAYVTTGQLIPGVF